MEDALAQGGALGAVVSVAALLYKLATIYLERLRIKKLNGSAELVDAGEVTHRAITEALRTTAVIQRDSLELLRALQHQMDETRRDIKDLPAQVALHVRAGR